MAEMVKDFWAGMPLGLYLILIIAIGLLITSFVLPPAGAIAPSALQGAALTIGGGWLYFVTANIPSIISSGAKIRAEYKGAKLEIGRNKKSETITEETKENNDTETFDNSNI